jgi:hypothetical protein
MRNAEGSLKLGFWKKISIGLLGGIAGEVAAFAVFFQAQSNWCRDMVAQGSYCDGQGPLVLILTVPLSAVVAATVSMLWTWASLAIPAQSPWASVFGYRGNNRLLNVALVLAVQAVYWAIFALAVYRLTRNLL